MTMVRRFAVCEQDRCWEGATLIAGLNTSDHRVCCKAVVLALDGHRRFPTKLENIPDALRCAGK